MHNFSGVQFEAVIFDIDGTLWDSTEEVAKAWNEAIRREPDIDRVLGGEELKREFGKMMEEIMDDLFPELDPSRKEELAVRMYARENEVMASAPCRRYAGLEETVRILSERFRLFIVSNCQSGYIEAFLKNTGLEDCIEDHLCSGDTGKPKGENIRLIMQRHHIRSAVYVGDTQGDADACREAGIPMIYAAYGFGKVKHPDAEIRELRELLKLSGPVGGGRERG